MWKQFFIAVVTKLILPNNILHFFSLKGLCIDEIFNDTTNSSESNEEIISDIAYVKRLQKQLTEKAYPPTN